MIAYLNGQYVPVEQCLVNVQDRAFMLGDGAYEVWVSHDRVFAHTEDHLERLQYSLAQLRISLPVPINQIPLIAERLQELNNLTNTQLFLEVTRGAGPRGHRFPDDPKPTLLMMAREAAFPTWEERQAGTSCATVPDLRWGRCDIKSISLLANVLATQAAAEQGGTEAILCRDGLAIEGASSNLFVVINGALQTHPAGRRILSGITRRHVLRYAQQLGMRVMEEPIPEPALWTASELFITSVSRDVLPVTTLNGRSVGGGRMGPISRAIYEKFHESHWGHKP